MTAKINPRIERFDTLSWMTWAEIDTDAEREEHTSLAAALSAQLLPEDAVPIIEAIRDYGGAWTIDTIIDNFHQLYAALTAAEATPHD
jgi:ribulose bisphosphate carboxylase small subunit